MTFFIFFLWCKYIGFSLLEQRVGLSSVGCPSAHLSSKFLNEISYEISGPISDKINIQSSGKVEEVCIFGSGHVIKMAT